MKTIVKNEYYKNQTKGKFLKDGKEIEISNPDIFIGNLAIDWNVSLAESKNSFELNLSCSDQVVEANVSFDTDLFEKEVDILSNEEYKAFINLSDIDIEFNEVLLNQDISPESISFELKEVIQVSPYDFNINVSKVKLNF